jgi:carboxymethylenebutenolidase
MVDKKHGGAKMKRQYQLFSLLLSLSVFLLVYSIVENVEASGTEIVTENVVYDNNEMEVKGFLARPADDKKHPALILIHEWWGLNENIRDNARQFAKAGYVALAVDLYKGQVATSPAEARKLATEVRNNKEEAFAHLNKAVHFLENQSASVMPERIASVGWCFGGGWSYEMARNNLGTKASVIYYGRFNPEDDLSKMRASILGHFAEKDRAIKVDTVRELQIKLKTLKGDHEVYIYPNTGHAFANPGGQNYNEEAAELAWKRTVVFLDKFLKK